MYSLPRRYKTASGNRCCNPHCIYLWPNPTVRVTKPQAVIAVATLNMNSEVSLMKKVTKPQAVIAVATKAKSAAEQEVWLLQNRKR